MQTRQKGMTLIEIVVVVAVLAFLVGASLAVIGPMSRMQMAEDVDSEMDRIVAGCRLYFAAQTALPSTLSVLGSSGYIQDRFSGELDYWDLDPWNQPYRYSRETTPGGNPHSTALPVAFTLSSDGPDGTPSTSDDYVKTVTVNDLHIQRVRLRTWQEVRNVNAAIKAFYRYRYNGTNPIPTTDISALVSFLSTEGLLPTGTSHLSDEYGVNYQIVGTGSTVYVRCNNTFAEGFLP